MKKHDRLFGRRLIAAAAAVLTVAAAALPASAAQLSYTAAYGTPKIDGVIEAGEYGAPQKLNKSTASPFFAKLDSSVEGWEDAIDFPDITYRFAWDEGHFYVAIEGDKIDNITNAKYQIDLSPENKIRDKQKGLFFTFQLLNAETGFLSVARDNYQTGGSTKVSVNITNKVKGAYRQKGSVSVFEFAIPLSELQVAGNGRDFTKLTLKAGKWGIATYYVGNSVGLTTSQGAGNWGLVTKNLEAGNLVEYFNDLTFAPKGSTPTNTTGGTQGKTTEKETAKTTAGVTSGDAKTTGTKQGDTVPGTTAAGAVEPSSAPEATDASQPDATAGGDADATDPTKADEVAPTGTQPTDTQPKDGPNVGLIAVIAVVVLAAAGAAVFFVLWAKKQPK